MMMMVKEGAVGKRELLGNMLSLLWGGGGIGPFSLGRKMTFFPPFSYVFSAFCEIS